MACIIESLLGRWSLIDAAVVCACRTSSGVGAEAQHVGVRVSM